MTHPPIHPPKQGYRVHFLGWSARWDEWVEAGSERIQPAYSKVNTSLFSTHPPTLSTYSSTRPPNPPTHPPAQRSTTGGPPYK